MRRSTLYCIWVFVVSALFAVSAPAQESLENYHTNISVGGGFTVPTAEGGSNLNTGWNLDFRGGLNVSRNFLADLDFTYNQWGLTRSALASFGQPNGHADVWALTFDPVFKLAPPHSSVKPYIIAGAGLYHRGLQVSHPANVASLFCDPFFGVCFPTVVTVDRVVASFSTYKPGFNAGGGFEFSIGNRGLKVFTEARYHQMFANHGPDMKFVPVTFGLRW
jgi:hypothetical protein